MFRRTNIYLFNILCLLNVLNASAQNFKVINGIPHLPVFESSADVASPVAGMMIASELPMIPQIYTGSEWSFLVSGTLTEATNESHFTVKNGIPILPAFDGAKITEMYVPIGTIFCSIGVEPGMFIWSGSNWNSFTELESLTLAEGSKFRTNNEADGFMIPFLSADPAGCSTGAIYYNIVSKSLRCQSGASWSTPTAPASPYQ